MSGGGGGGGGGGQTVGDVLGAALLATLERAEEELDAKLDKLDERPDEDEVERLRAARLARLKSAAGERAAWAARGHGAVREPADQAAFFAEVKTEARAVVHFYRGSNRRCDIVDAHLRALAPRHMETKFLRVDAVSGGGGRACDGSAQVSP